MRVRQVLAALVVGACLVSGLAQAASADTKRGELSALRDRIKGLQDEISRSEETHEEAADGLAASDKGISAAQQRLRDISRQRAEAEAEVARIEGERRALEAQIAQLRKQLGDAVFRTYVEGGQGGTRRFLSGDAPNQIARDAYYLELIARHRMQAIDAARAALEQQQTLLAQAEAKRAEMAELETQRRSEQQSLLAERKHQREVLTQISSQLKTQRKQMATLQRDENRMEQLIKGLERIARQMAAQSAAAAAASSRAAAAAAAAAASRAAGSTSPGGSAGSAHSTRSAPEVREPVTGRADSVARAETQEGDFGERKGRLHWPVKGELTGRFGAQRAEGLTTWRGVFIRAAQGSEVRAVASGKVAFADWLRGFGNLVILDHGDGYMTVYGNNDALFVQAGHEVRAGDPIASVGASGGQEESGLYFEIRHRGQAQDPARWIAR